VRVTNSTGCKKSDTINVTVSPCNFIGENIKDGNAIIISPNPSTGIFDLQLSIDKEQFNKAELNVYTILGEVVYQTEIKNLNSKINLSELAKGIYFAQIITNKQTIVRKVVLE